MTAVVAALLALACALDCIARGTGARRLELVAKPLATCLVIALALARGSDDDAVLALLVGALLACLAGDVLLLPALDRFLAGLAAFLAGHLLFAAAAAARGLPRPGAALLAGVAAALLIPAVGRTILAGAARSDPRLRAPVAVYMLAVGGLAPMAAATGRGWALFGAACFAVSDSILGWDRFVGRLGWAPVAVMITYHLALIGLALGLP